jgi:spore coat polysaccharide biosynthesis predicted glycosyltransferase SpsG
MSKDYEEFMSSQKTKEKITDIKKTTKTNEYNDEKKLDLILEKLENIEKHLGIKTNPDPKTIYDDMEVGYTVKDTAKILGCSINKVRNLQNISALTSYMLGRQKMITSESIKNVIGTLSGKKV